VPRDEYLTLADLIRRGNEKILRREIKHKTLNVSIDAKCVELQYQHLVGSIGGPFILLDVEFRNCD
jgi:hypothetical protein